jgi:hypothetical protein
MRAYVWGATRTPHSTLPDDSVPECDSFEVRGDELKPMRLPRSSFLGLPVDGDLKQHVSPIGCSGPRSTADAHCVPTIAAILIAHEELIATRARRAAGIAPRAHADAPGARGLPHRPRASRSGLLPAAPSSAWSGACMWARRRAVGTRLAAETKTAGGHAIASQADASIPADAERPLKYATSTR